MSLTKAEERRVKAMEFALASVDRDGVVTDEATQRVLDRADAFDRFLRGVESTKRRSE